MNYEKNPSDTLVSIRQQFSRLFLSYVFMEVTAVNWKMTHTLRFIISVIAFQLLIKSRAKMTISEEDTNVTFSEILCTHTHTHQLFLPTPLTHTPVQAAYIYIAIYTLSEAFLEKPQSVTDRRPECDRRCRPETSQLQCMTCWIPQRSSKGEGNRRV